MRLNYNRCTGLFSLLIVNPYSGLEYHSFKYSRFGHYHKYSDDIYIIVSSSKMRKVRKGITQQILLTKTKYPRLRLLKQNILDLF